MCYVSYFFCFESGYFYRIVSFKMQMEYSFCVEEDLPSKCFYSRYIGREQASYTDSMSSRGE